MIEKLKELRNQMHPPTLMQIARLLQVSRNAVAGKCHRLGLCVTKNEADRAYQRERKREKDKERMRLWRAMKKNQRIVTPSLPDIVPAPDIEGIPLLLRDWDQCAYPIERQIVCGAPVHKTYDSTGALRSYSWCPFHYKVVFRQRSAA